MSIATPTTEESVESANKAATKRQPRYHVRLWDDNEHTFVYVIRMLRDLFGYNFERGQQLAVKVDSIGSAVCYTTTKEHAELKRDQILSYGRDAMVAASSGSMGCSIEPEE